MQLSFALITKYPRPKDFNEIESSWGHCYRYICPECRQNFTVTDSPRNIAYDKAIGLAVNHQILAHSSLDIDVPVRRRKLTVNATFIR